MDTYEKKYNEALKRAKAAIDMAADKDLVKGVATTIFPELRESEDERIRKAALEGIEYLERKLGWDAIGDIDILDVKEYLEKQKEQKPVECVADSIKFDEGFKTGREVGFREGVESVKSAGWSEEDSIHLKDAILSAEKVWGNESCTATWLKSFPQRFNLQPKQEWSEEDRNRVAQYLHDMDGGMLWSKATEITRDILDMLRPSWKPSAHQMTILKAVKEYVGKGSGYWGEALGSLIEDLEKLV